MRPLHLVKLELWEDDILFIIEQLSTRAAYLNGIAQGLSETNRKRESEEYAILAEKCKLTADVLSVLMVAANSK